MSPGRHDVQPGFETPHRESDAGADRASRASAALAALDAGDDTLARRILEEFAGGAAAPLALGFDALEQGELENAFAEAEPEADAMRDANQLAYDAIRAAALDGPEGVATPAEPASPFQTRTMAALLERQGDAAAAQSIRSTLARRERPADANSASGSRRRSDRIRTLERWLGRVRRGDA